MDHLEKSVGELNELICLMNETMVQCRDALDFFHKKMEWNESISK